MNALTTFGDGTTPVIDVSGLTDTLTVAKFVEVIQAVLPIVAVAVLVGFICYFVRYAIRLFRGI